MRDRVRVDVLVARRADNKRLAPHLRHEGGRGHIVKLTPRGHEAYAVAGRVFGDLEAKWEEALGERRMTQLARCSASSQDRRTWCRTITCMQA